MEKIINKQIARLRKERKLTQEQLAKAVGVTNQSVSKWEKGICCPDIQLLPVIASYFGVSIDELFGNTDAQKGFCSCEEPVGKIAISETMFLKYEDKIANKTAQPEDYYYYAEMLDKCALDYIMKAKKWYQRTINLTKETQTEEYYQAQKKLITLRSRIGEREESIRDCVKQREENPKLWWNDYLLAFAYKESGNMKKAWEIIKVSIEKFPNGKLYELAGDVSRGMGMYEDAINYWTTAFELDASTCSPIYSKAYLLEKMGEHEKAIQAWEMVVRWRHENRQDENHELDWPLLKIEGLKKYVDK